MLRATAQRTCHLWTHHPRTGEPKTIVLPAPSSPQRLKDLMEPLDLTFPERRSQEERHPQNRILALPITM